jgi:hypothetical protein
MRAMAALMSLRSIIRAGCLARAASASASRALAFLA